MCIVICFVLIFLNQMPNCIIYRLKLAVVAVVIIVLVIRTIGTQVSQQTSKQSNNNNKNTEVTYGKLKYTDVLLRA